MCGYDLFSRVAVPALYMKPQSILSMYAYGATTGVVGIITYMKTYHLPSCSAVDIGDRLDVVPIDQGYVIDKGVTKLRYGGAQVTESLGRAMSELGHRQVLISFSHHVVLNVMQLLFDCRELHSALCEGATGLR